MLLLLAAAVAFLLDIPVLLTKKQLIASAAVTTEVALHIPFFVMHDRTAKKE